MWENSLSNTMQNALSTCSKRISYLDLPATEISAVVGKGRMFRRSYEKTATL